MGFIRDKMKLVAVLASALAAIPLTAAEIGTYESELESVPSYAVYLDAGLYLGASPGLGVSGLVNINSALSGVLPFLNHVPKLYVEASMPLVSVNATELIASCTGGSYTGQDPFIGSLMGFGGEGFRLLGGIDLFGKENLVTQAWIVDRSETSRYTTTTYYPITAPMYQSTILMFGASYERSGGEWLPAASEFDDPILQDGSRLYWQARLRLQEVRRFRYTATALGGAQRLFRNWNYADITAIASADFQQFGAGLGFASIGNLLSFKMDFGCVYRLDAPGDDILNKIYMPLTFSMGVGGMPIPLNKNDRYWNSKR